MLPTGTAWSQVTTATIYGSVRHRGNLSATYRHVNVVNHVNPADINTGLNAGTFGQVRGVAGQRVINLMAVSAGE